MKASVYRNYGTPGVLSIEDVEQPVPGEGQVLVRVRAALVTASDSAARSGIPAARLYFGIVRPKWRVLGSEFAGRVQAVGSGVTRFSVGDDVYGSTGVDFGAHAEYVVVAQDAVIGPKPELLDHVESAAIFDGAMTALPFLRDSAGLQPGQTILINGASGAVGTAAVQIAKHLRAEVTAVCSSGNAELVSLLGADHVIDYTAEDFTRASQRYDVIFDAVGKSSFSRARRALKPGGIYLTTVPTLGILLWMAWTSRFGRKRARIAFTGLRRPEQMAADLAVFTELAESEKLVPVIDEQFPFDRIADAHRRVDSGHKRGNVVLTFDTSANAGSRATAATASR